MPDDTRPARPANRALVLAAILAGGTIFAVMLAPLASGKFYLDGDLGSSYIPTRYFYHQCLAHGDDFRWIPSLYCGVSLYGEGQASIYHPAHLLTYALLPWWPAFFVDFVASYLVLFAGTFLLLRRWGVGGAGAGFGALAFTFQGFYVHHYQHMNASDVVAHLPWALLAIDSVMRPTGPRSAAWGGAGLALILTSMILTGYPMYVAMCGLVAGFYTLGLLIAGARPRRLMVLAWAAVCGVLAGAIQLLPTADSLALSVRGTPTFAYITQGSLHPWNLAQIIAPYLFRDRCVQLLEGADHAVGLIELGLYAGVATPALMLWLALRKGGDPGRRRMALGLAILAAVGLLLALGRNTPASSLFYWLPGLNKFRVFARYTMIYHFASACLAALAFDDLARVRPNPDPAIRRRAWWLLLVPLATLATCAGAVAAAKVWPGRWPFDVIADKPHLLMSVASSAAAAGLVILAARGHRLALFALLAYVAADESAYLRGFMRVSPPAPIKSIFEPVPEATPTTPSGYRLGGDTDCVLTMSGHALVKGYGIALVPRRALDYDRPEALRLAGAGWRATWKDLYPWAADPKRPPPDQLWDAIPDPLPRAWMTPREVVSDDPAATLPTIDPRDVTIVADAQVLGGGAAGEAKVTEDRPGRIRVQTSAPTRQLLVVGERWDPGWVVRVDGKPADLLQVDGDFQGVVVGPGDAEVAFRYEPRSFRRGAILSAAGLALTLATLAAALLRKPRERQPGTTMTPEPGPTVLPVG